ncbi:hypothetical protein RJ639_033876 [Escallonia herrerae]|uniref:Heat shock protein 70 n=1 Tax=Escallonia herrerae TaxID=1293975 RepID=A0AA88WWT2_9ASTE|nr:hypothetical protein RJ639_033876 [Escallonia herrerae]
MAGKGEGPAIGIDLGTTYSCVGVWQHDHVEIITNDQGNRTTPSYVAFTDSERLIGDAAKNQVAMNPINTVFGTTLLDIKNGEDAGACDEDAHRSNSKVSGRRKRKSRDNKETKDTDKGMAEGKKKRMADQLIKKIWHVGPLT